MFWGGPSSSGPNDFIGTPSGPGGDYWREGSYSPTKFSDETSPMSPMLSYKYSVETSPIDAAFPLSPEFDSTEDGFIPGMFDEKDGFNPWEIAGGTVGGGEDLFEESILAKAPVKARKKRRATILRDDAGLTQQVTQQ